MNVRNPISSPEMDRKISAMIAEVLDAPVIEAARNVATRHFSEWLHLGQLLWVAEPRHFDAERIDMSLLLSAHGPLDLAIIEAGIALRPHNVVLKAMLEGRSREPAGPLDFVSKRTWEYNPFRAEVLQPLGMPRVLAVEIVEGKPDPDALLLAVLSREGSPFTDVERQWIARARTMLEPILAYIRLRGTLQAHGSWLEAEAAGKFTPAEQEVFHWMCQGKRNKEIAIILNRSHRTVEKHVQSILAKSGAETRTAAAALRSRESEAP